MRGFAERMAMNTPIQGSAADIIKKAMVNVFEKIDGKFKTKLIAQVHDELIFDCTPDEDDEITNIVVSTKEEAVKFDDKLKLDYNTRKNWYQAK
jgi:DNA polymerase-1